MRELYYIITTQLPDCLNRLLEAGDFHHLRKNQPASGPFLDEMLSKSPNNRPAAKFILFDRVRGSDTARNLVAAYDFVDLRVDDAAGLQMGNKAYTVTLKKTRDLAPAIPFGQGTPLWERLETTRNKKTTTFYCGGRMLLPIPREDYEAILEFTAPDVAPVSLPIVDALASATGDNGIAVPAESELHAYLAQNLAHLEPGLQPYDPDNFMEVTTDDGGRIDLLCRDKDRRIVVVELKKGAGDDKVVGQLARYIGWAKQKIANGDQVRGVIVAHVISDRLKQAARAFDDVRLVAYEVTFKLRVVQ
ncbi:MAG: endonuclease NucS domain-containing protein [Gammaproteobacteria bacterium]